MSRAIWRRSVLRFDRDLALHLEHAAVVAGDVAFAATVLSNDFHFRHGDGWTRGEKIGGIEDDRAAFLKRIADREYLVHDLDQPKVEMHGDVAVTWGRYVSLFGLGILLLGLIMSFTSVDMIGLSFLCLIVGFISSQVGIYYANRYARVDRPDEVLARALKGFDDRRYRQLGGRLQPILDTIRQLHAMGVWVELVTLLVPGFNDSPEELWDAARFLVSVSPDIPWHVTAFHPDYKMQDRERTTASLLQRAAEVGQEAGLHYVYAGNLPGRVGSLEDTFCPQCQARLVRRHGFTVYENRVTPDGKCPKCGTSIPGVWS